MAVTCGVRWSASLRSENWNNPLGARGASPPVSPELLISIHPAPVPPHTQASPEARRPPMMLGTRPAPLGSEWRLHQDGQAPAGEGRPDAKATNEDGRTAAQLALEFNHPNSHRLRAPRPGGGGGKGQAAAQGLLEGQARARASSSFSTRFRKRTRGRTTSRATPFSRRTRSRRSSRRWPRACASSTPTAATPS